MRDLNERGIAMITTLLVIMLMSALLVGFTAVIMSDQRYRFIDHDRGQAFYGASGGIEKLTGDLGNLFFSQLAPTNAQVTALTTPPVITDPITGLPVVTYSATIAPTPLPASYLASYYCGSSPPALNPPTYPITVGTIGYTITFCSNVNSVTTGNPVATSTLPVKTGPYAGLIALQTPFQLDVTARTTTGGEVHLIRSMEAVAIPVFQFGTFSDVDLAFFAGSNFNFGGRVHTNGNVFLAEGNGATLTLTDKVTAVGEVITQRLQNGVSIDTGPAHTGTVSLATSVAGFPNCAVGCRTLARTEGSVVDGLGSALNDPTFHTISLSTYNSYIRNGRTGAKALNLPLLTVGGTNPDLIRRPCQVGASTLTVTQLAPLPPLVEQLCSSVAVENVSNPVLLNERLFTKASLRILLSDTAADITNLPGVTATAPVQLDTNWNSPAALLLAAPGYGPISATNPPIARTPGPLPAAFTIRGQQNAGTWSTTLNVNNIPATFQVTQLTIAKVGSIPPTRAVNCTGKTRTTFTGCTNPLTPGLPWVGNWNLGTITVAAATPVNSTTPTATVTANWPTLTTTINVDDTSDFVQQDWFFVTPHNGTAQTFVQCTGYDNSAPSLLGCAAWNSTATPPAVFTTATVPRLDDTTQLYSDALSNAQTGTIGGFIKIEKQDTNGVWTDVTLEILNYGIAGPNMAGAPCAAASAILQIQRYRDNGGSNGVNGGGCNYAGSTNAADYWPNALFDTREGLLRDVDPGNTNVTLGGVMYYATIDVQNLTKWFTGTAPLNTPGGANARVNNTGYTVYFSDRRNNRNAANLETAEYGFEDFVNPAAANGAPNGTLDTGEDLNANGVVDVYGKLPNYNGAHYDGTAATLPPGAQLPLNGTALPTTTLSGGQAQVNRAILFRHALMLINGQNIRDLGGAGLGIGGLSIVAENPVYVQGNWNVVDAAGGPDFNIGRAHAATSVIADTVTLLSNEWSDANSFTSPYNPNNRPVTTQPWYRLAIIAGKGMAFPQPTVGAPPTDFGTDGGAHNFLRLLEDGGQQVNYEGSTATFFYNRQGVGTFKCCNTVYGVPTRNFVFDTDFLNPALLPPNTPVFRDINAVGFSQELRPGR